MKSPNTGKPMQINVCQADMLFRGEHFWVWYIFYCCEDTEKRYTDEVLDTLNLYQVYQQYAKKHNIPLEDVMPK